MTTVAVYHRSVPNTKNQEKVDALRFFSQGVKAAGDSVIDVPDWSYRASEVAVIQGWVTDRPEVKAHLALRNQVIKTQLASHKHVVGIDSNLFLYADTRNQQHYLRFSFDGIFPNTGIYCDTDPDPDRWRSISQRLNISVKDWRDNGEHILLLLQRNGGWSMSGFDVQDWCNQVIAQIRAVSNRPIVVRAHPGDRQAMTYLDPATGSCRIAWGKSVRLSRTTDLLADLKNCWAAVNHNSSPVVAAALEGVPVFVTDPARSQCREIANTDFAQIENPRMPDRQAWVERLAMSHWNFQELQLGHCWRHMRQFI